MVVLRVGGCTKFRDFCSGALLWMMHDGIVGVARDGVVCIVRATR